MIETRPGVIGGREQPVISARAIHKIVAPRMPFDVWSDCDIKFWELHEGIDLETQWIGDGVDFDFTLDAAEKVISTYPTELCKYADSRRLGPDAHRVAWKLASKHKAGPRTQRRAEPVEVLVYPSEAEPAAEAVCEPVPHVEPSPEPVKVKKIPTAKPKPAPKPKVEKIAKPKKARKPRKPLVGVTCPLSGRIVDERQITMDFTF